MQNEIILCLKIYQKKNHCRAQINNVMNDDRCHQQMSCKSFTKKHFYSHHPIYIINNGKIIYYSNFGYICMK